MSCILAEQGKIALWSTIYCTKCTVRLLQLSMLGTTSSFFVVLCFGHMSYQSLNRSWFAIRDWKRLCDEDVSISRSSWTESTPCGPFLLTLEFKLFAVNTLVPGFHLFFVFKHLVSMLLDTCQYGLSLSLPCGSIGCCLQLFPSLLNRGF